MRAGELEDADGVAPLPFRNTVSEGEPVELPFHDAFRARHHRGSLRVRANRLSARARHLQAGWLVFRGHEDVRPEVVFSPYRSQLKS